jgi:formylglycine-generating enzyme required for sulfatase activity
MRCGADGTWETQAECDAICSNAECMAPPSCEGAGTVCAGGESCCKAILLPPESSRETFSMRYARDIEVDGDTTQTQATVPRTIRPFTLDRFEVTIGRFREFLRVYDRVGPPPADSGAHPAFPDSGWRAEWSETDGPWRATSEVLVGDLSAQGQSFDQGAPDDLPVRAVNWYVALAFCIWDRGRLPTEAEWAYAALGGKEDREYPWQTDLGDMIDHEHALYSDELGMIMEPAPVGSYPSGMGAFDHDDLAGNVIEWVADATRETLESSCNEPGDEGLDEHECLERGRADARVLRGGSFANVAVHLRNVERSWSFADSGLPHVGFRCARDVSTQ